MKKLVLIVVAVLSSFFTFAQQRLQWNEHSLTFSVPSDFKETKNSSDIFEATGNGMSITLRSSKDETLTEDDIYRFTMDLAEQMDLDMISGVESTKIKGLAGAYVMGRRQGVVHYLLGIIDPDSENNFYAMVPFNDNIKGAEDTALKIIQSVKPY